MLGQPASHLHRLWTDDQPDALHAGVASRLRFDLGRKPLRRPWFPAHGLQQSPAGGPHRRHVDSDAGLPRNDPFVVYWSVCNVGASSSAAVATPQGLQVTGPSFGQTFSYSIPALGSCQCVVPIPQVQFAAGLATTGTYTASLVGQFSTSATITINP